MPGDPEGRERRAELNRRLRLASIEGAEERSHRALGRGVTKEELDRILRRYPGDLPETERDTRRMPHRRRVEVITRVDLDLGQPQHQDATYLERCWRATSDTVVR